MWDPPGSGVKPVSPELAGFTTGPPGKLEAFFKPGSFFPFLFGYQLSSMAHTPLPRLLSGWLIWDLIPVSSLPCNLPLCVFLWVEDGGTSWGQGRGGDGGGEEVGHLLLTWISGPSCMDCSSFSVSKYCHLFSNLLQYIPYSY